MAGSDINVVSKNKAALSNVASNVPTTVTIFGGPMRLKGFIIEPTDIPLDYCVTPEQLYDFSKD